MFPFLLAQIERLDIVFVTSAGNTGQPISNDPLKRFGGPDTSMIVVGGVEANTLAIWPMSGTGAALTVRAQSTMTNTAGNAGNAAVAVSDGTSQAAAAVSGLAAYFLSKPEFAASLLVQSQVAMRVKKFLIASAEARVRPGVTPSIACNGENFTPAEVDVRQALFDFAVSSL